MLKNDWLGNSYLQECLSKGGAIRKVENVSFTEKGNSLKNGKLRTMYCIHLAAGDSHYYEMNKALFQKAIKDKLGVQVDSLITEWGLFR